MRLLRSGDAGQVRVYDGHCIYVHVYICAYVHYVRTYIYTCMCVDMASCDAPQKYSVSKLESPMVMYIYT